MTLKEIAYSLEKALTKHKITDDSRVSIAHLEYLVNRYRAIAIEEKYIAKKGVNPTWVQRFTNVHVTEINSADDPAVSGCNCSFGKIVIPTIIDLPEDKAVQRVSSVCGTKKYYPISFDRFMELIPGSPRANFDYFMRIGNCIYIKDRNHTGQPRKAAVDLILEDPLEGYVMMNKDVDSSSLVVGKLYKVVSGRISHNSVAYEKGQTFTAVNTTFTGKGLVELANPKSLMTHEDPYPMDETLSEYITLKILKSEFGIEEQVIADKRNDSQDEQIRLQP